MAIFENCCPNLLNFIFRVLSGEFQVVNQHLLRDLTELNLWNEDLKNYNISANGSVQNIDVRFCIVPPS